MNIAGLQGKAVERTIRQGRAGAGELEVGRVCGGYRRGEITTIFVAVRPLGTIEKWELDGGVRLSSMAIAQREGVTPGAKIVTHDKLEQHARDVVAHCRNRWESDGLHYAVVCWDDKTHDPRRWGIAASYLPGPGGIADAGLVMAELFERMLGGDACEICGATEDLYHYDTVRGQREIWACQSGDCGQKLQRQEREEAGERLDRELDAVPDRATPRKAAR